MHSVLANSGFMMKSSCISMNVLNPQLNDNFFYGIIMFIYTNERVMMLEALNLKKISISDKFLMMEEIWKDLSEHSAANGFSPQWHYDVLAEREKKIADGKMEFSPISEAKERLRKLTHEN